MELERVCGNLKARGFEAQVFQRAQDAADYLDSVLDGVSIGFGGSVTLQSLDLYDRLARHNDVHWHWTGGAEERLRAMRTDAYLTSVNALSESGELVNIDGIGNRLAAVFFGHERVYFVVGQNKIVPTYEEAVWRARNIAAPKNAQRLGADTPCAVRADRCYDCRSPGRICRGMATLWEPMMGTRMEVLLIAESLGL